MTTEILTQDMVLALLESDEEFPVDFDKAWKWVGYTTKHKAKLALTGNFEKGIDFSTEWLKTPGGGRSREQIDLTVDCFKSFGMMAGTERGRQIRQYFLNCEKELKKRLLEDKQKPQSKLDATMERWRLNFQNNMHSQDDGVNWSVLLELYQFLMRIEASDFEFPDGRSVDVSVGICWAAYVKKTHPELLSEVTSYSHRYLDGRVVQANLYPVCLLGEFKRWLHKTYTAKQFPEYIRKMIKAGEVTRESCEALARALNSSTLLSTVDRKQLPMGDDCGQIQIFC